MSKALSGTSLLMVDDDPDGRRHAAKFHELIASRGIEARRRILPARKIAA